MDGEWPEQYNDLYNWLGLGYPGGDNQAIQHNLGAEVNGLPGAAANMGNNTNAAAADQGNGGGQANGDQRAGTRHFRRRHTVAQIQILEAYNS